MQLLAGAEHLLRKGIHALHPEPFPVGGEFFLGLLEEFEVVPLGIGAVLFIMAQLADRVHQAADAVFGEEDRLRVAAQVADAGLDLRRVRHGRIDVRIARPLEVPTERPGLGRALIVGALGAPGVFPLRAAGVADRPDVVLPVPPPALLQDEPRTVQRAEQGEAFHGVLRHRAVAHLVDQSENDDARMVPVAQHHLAQIGVEPLGHFRRIGQEPRGHVLLVDHQSDLIAQVQLVWMGQARDEPDHVETARFHVKQVFAQQVRRARRWQNRADRRVVSGVRALQKNPLPVQPEVAFLDAQLAKTEPRDVLMNVRRGARDEARRQAIEPRIVELPQTVACHGQLALDPFFAGRQFFFHGQRRDRLVAERRRDGEVQLRIRGGFARVDHGGLDLHLAGFPIRPHVDILDPHGRDPKNLHRLGDAAAVVGSSGSDSRGRLVPVGRFGQHDAVDRFRRGIEDADGEPVGCPDAHHISDIQHKRRLASLVAADRHVVQPHVGEVVDRVKTQKAAAAGIGVSRRRELAPIPGNAVIAGQRLLQDARHADRPGARSRRLPPRGAAPCIVGVGGDDPILALQRQDRCARRL